jgi:hypothetical protein
MPVLGLCIVPLDFFRLPVSPLSIQIFWGSVVTRLPVSATFSFISANLKDGTTFVQNISHSEQLPLQLHGVVRELEVLIRYYLVHSLRTYHCCGGTILL